MVVCDICSDLHIDQWNKNLYQKYPCGIREYNNLSWEKKDNTILIIAGDISDNIDLSIKFIDDISENYDKILFVDGNHEHVDLYPKLYSMEYINQKIKKKENDKLIYLPCNDYIVNDTVFIGFCGWWNYNNYDSKEIKKSLDYFKNWIDNFTESDSRDFIYNVFAKSKYEYNELIFKLNKYHLNNNISNIVIVTHTQPDISFVNLEDLGSELNTKFENITSSKFPKIKYWIFGHTHAQHNTKKNNIEYICNPRGRPEDFNRTNYNLHKLIIK